MLLYLLRHSLPWQGLKAPNKDQKEELILEKKEKKTISVETLCDGLPREFVAYFNHIRPLGFLVSQNLSGSLRTRGVQI